MATYRFRLRLGVALMLATAGAGLVPRWARAGSEAAPAPAVSGETGGFVPEAPSLPEGIVPGATSVVNVPGDRALLVIHAPAENRRPIIYLHGRCGNPRAAEAFRDAAIRAGTLISVLGDYSCGEGRYRWGKKLDEIQLRIERALRVVETVRGGLLDREELVLFGYSQGADRAEALAAGYPGRYPRLVLGGSSREPALEHLGDARAVAVFGGELETFGHMLAGAEVLAAAGKTAKFFLLPKAKHGDFGPDGNRVMTDVFSWLLAADES